MQWQAQIADDFNFGANRRVRLGRVIGDQLEVITGFDDDGHPTITRHEPGTTSDFRGLLIPIEALEAIAELLKPGPSQGEVRRLEEALDVERRRVDDILRFALRPAPLTVD